eukprot:g32353.t1
MRRQGDDRHDRTTKRRRLTGQPLVDEFARPTDPPAVPSVRAPVAGAICIYILKVLSLAAKGHLEKWGRPHFSVTLTKSLDCAQMVPIRYMTVLDVAYGAADRASGKGDGLGDSGPRPEPEPVVEIEFACRGGAAPMGIASSAGMPMGPAERLGEAARALPRFMPAPAGQDDGSDEEDDEEDVDILTIDPPLPTTPPPLPLTPPPPAPVPEEERPAKRRCLHAPTGKHYKYCELQRATDKDKKKCGWQESDGPAIKVVWQDLETKHRSRSLEPLDYVLTWQEEDGHYADLHWRRTIMEEVMGKSTPYRPVGDSSVVSRAGACSAGTAVAQRFRLDKPYACLAMALFNLCNAPKRYKEKLRSEFKRSVDCYPIFYEYLNELEKQGRALAIVSREPLKKRGTGWLFDGTAPLGILIHKGHAYGIDPARQLGSGRWHRSHFVRTHTLSVTLRYTLTWQGSGSHYAELFPVIMHMSRVDFSADADFELFTSPRDETNYSHYLL